jgi:hypothetical protein
MPGNHQSGLETVAQHPEIRNLQRREALSSSSVAGKETASINDTTETVKTTILVSLSTKSDEPPFLLPASYLCVNFSMRCAAAPQVYLLVGDDCGTTGSLHQMEKDEGARWHLALRLEPGAYRYRYYYADAEAPTGAQRGDSDNAPISMNDFASFDVPGLKGAEPMVHMPSFEIH